MTTSTERADTATRAERAADLADMRARDTDRISRWTVVFAAALFIGIVLQGFETRLAVASLEAGLEDAARDRAAIRAELRAEIASVRTDVAEALREFGNVLADGMEELEERLDSLDPTPPREDPRQ